MSCQSLCRSLRTLFLYSCKFKQVSCFARCCAGLSFCYSLLYCKTAAKTKHLHATHETKWLELMKWIERRKRNFRITFHTIKPSGYAIESNDMFLCLSLEFRRPLSAECVACSLFLLFMLSQRARHKYSSAFGLVLPLNKIVMCIIVSKEKYCSIMHIRVSRKKMGSATQIHFDRHYRCCNTFLLLG